MPIIEDYSQTVDWTILQSLEIDNFYWRIEDPTSTNHSVYGRYQSDDLGSTEVVVIADFDNEADALQFIKDNHDRVGKI